MKRETLTLREELSHYMTMYADAREAKNVEKMRRILDNVITSIKERIPKKQHYKNGAAPIGTQRFGYNEAITEVETLLGEES